MSHRVPSVIIALTALAAGSTTGCPETITVGPLPAEVAYFVVVEREGSTIVDATALQAADRATTIFGDLGRDLEIVGYAREPLEAWIAEFADGVIPDLAMTAAEGCIAMLPRPVWRAENNGGTSFTSADTADAPDLTAPWLQRCAPIDVDSVSVNVACESGECVRSKEQVGPCRVRVNLGDCNQPSATVLIRPDDTACIEPNDDRVCLQADPPLEAAASLRCNVDTGAELVNDCATEVLVARQPFLRTAAERDLFSLPTNFPEWVNAQFQIMRSRDLRRGPLLDVVALSDRVGVLGLPGEGTTIASTSCDQGPRPRAVHIFDLLSLDITQTTAALPCAEHLVAAPGGQGFIYVALTPANGTWSIARTDADGRLVAEAPLPLSPPERVQDLISAADDSGQVYALVLSSSVSESSGATILAIDGQSLEVTGTTVENGRFSVLAAFASGELLLGSQTDGNIELLRGPFDDPSRDRIPYIPMNPFGERRVIGLAPAGNGLDAAVVISGNQSLSIGWGPATPGTAGPLDAELQPGPVVPWPAHPGQVLVGGLIIDSPISGFVQAFDVPSARWRPGPVITGVSAVTSIATHPSGDVYALQGWAGRLLRLTPEP